jgi:MFS family permease
MGKSLTYTDSYQLKLIIVHSTSISVALPIIAKKLNGTAIEAFWAGTSFLLTSTVFQPNYASFSHIFGRKPMVLVAITFFFIGVMIAAFANNFALLLIGRSLQGVGGGGIIALTEIIVTDLVPLRFRGQWVGIIGGMWSIGSVTGPIIGGVFAQKTTWRWIFWINLPFIGAGYLMVPLFLKLNFLPSSMASKLRRVDWIGSILFIGSMTSFLIPITWGGVMYSWSSWRTLLPLLIGAAGLIAFCLYERYFAPEPVIRLAIFANRTANIAYFNTVIHGLILWCILYYMPLYFEAVKGYSPIVSGVALFPASFTVAPSAVVIGFLITKTGQYRWSIWLGWTLTTLGVGILHLLDTNTKIPQWIFIDLISGLGLGILFPSLQFQLQAASDNKHLAFAVAMFSFFRSFGQALGVAIGGVIFQNQMVKKLMAYPQFRARAHELARDAASLVQIIRDTPEGVDKFALRSAYADSLKTVYVVLTALAGVALVLSLFVRSYDLNRGLETEQFLKTGEKSVGAALEEGKGMGKEGVET